MLFSVIAGLVIFALIVWLTGQYFQYTGIAVIGATTMIIAGSAIALTGVEVRTGEVRHFNYQLENNSTDYVLNRSATSYEYQTTALATVMNVGIVAPLGLGGLVMLLGATMLANTLTREV